MTESADAPPVAPQDAEWRTSSYTASNSNCVEVARFSGERIVAVRDTKDRARGAFVLGPTAWTSFVNHLKRDAD
ncbi:DUF397 domain-containing protein [Streptomyces sp. 3MP-14]|uniref:DUF397 domain-containing protein n=1 Tax=Streptomyces mimosae TaxID=2586635 RepID=A0A5N6ABN2_9ACTN|nr:MULTISPECIES: DUF397 domain-containing protein [Streptomyces]KAB8165239.1 DUF397 domain-containing protein [Streptomyces mimosae]KAB8175871.1 DUF397 domain-containing protein [Streptomyces sp. 3MP-14]